MSDTQIEGHSLKVNPVVSALYRTIWDALNPRVGFVFCATTGRSGTSVLARIIDAAADGCRAVHEPWPKMNDQVLRARNDGDPALADRVYWTRKSVNVRRLARGHRWYLETNHFFIKSFWERAHEDFGARMRVVHLRRHPVMVARSMAQLSAAPGSAVADEWYLNHEWGRNRLTDLVPELGAGGELSHPFHRCLWYWYEIEERVRFMRARIPDVPVFELSWTDELDVDGIAELLDWLDLSYDRDEIERRASVRVNLAIDRKREVLPDLPVLHDMHRTFQDHLERAGYSLDAFRPFEKTPA